MSTNTKNIAVILGARPNFIKAAPLLRRAKAYPAFNFTLVHTGQHYDDTMSRVFFDEMHIPRPTVQFQLTGDNSSEQIGSMLSQLKEYFKTNLFDGIIAIGDVNSTLAGALTAAKHGQTLIHIEAGLRSFDRRMPEESNRIIIDHLSDLLFTTEPAAVENLKKEGCDETHIKHVGNLMIETLETFKDKIHNSSATEKYNLTPKQFVLATIHRQENIYDRERLKNILLLLNTISAESTVAFTLHPATKGKIEEFSLRTLLASLNVLPPLGYFDFMKLVHDSTGVITDSGGIQEETTHLGIPCATLRENTERPITIEQGSNKLFEPHRSATHAILTHLGFTHFNAGHIPLWDSEVSDRIFKELTKYYEK